MKKQIIVIVSIVCSLLVGSFISADDPGAAIQSQAQRSLGLMLQNISRPDAAKGSVVAAPSKANPDYFFHWIRDAALVMDSLVQLYSRSGGAQKQMLHTYLMDYISFSRKNQLTPNRSGGLGEPKFEADGSAFQGDWGRPQNDGPALRAMTLIHLAHALIREGQMSFVRQTLYDGKIPTNTVIKADLEYVAHHWQEFSFDPWEEVGGNHFYTTFVSRGAMIQGAALAQALGDTGAAAFYRQQAQAITQAMNQFWDAQHNVFLETRGGARGKSGLDTAVILAVLHGESGDGFLAPTSDGVISTFYALMTAFEKIYPINQDSKVAPAIGRYPEDVYNGTGTSEGNPWFLTTLAYAEFCNRLRVEYAHAGAIHVTSLNQAFLNLLLQGHGSAQPGTTISSGSPEFSAVVSGLGVMGDKFFETVLLHKGADGSLSEQINRHQGFMQGAPNLSWSHASFITATLSRGAR